MKDNYAAATKWVLRCFSIVLMVFAFFFSYTWPGGYCLGDSCLSGIGLPSWSNGSHGTHYTVLYSLGIIFCSFFIYSATTQKKLNTFMYLLCGFLVLFVLANIIW